MTVLTCPVCSAACESVQHLETVYDVNPRRGRATYRVEPCGHEYDRSAITSETSL